VSFLLVESRMAEWLRVWSFDKLRMTEGKAISATVRDRRYNR
jgi:hypothetical protein